MQYLAGILTALVIGFLMVTYVGSGLLPLLVAFGLGLMAYGLVDMKMKKGADDAN